MSAPSPRPERDQISAMVGAATSKASALSAAELEQIERQSVADYFDAAFEKLEAINRRRDERARLRRGLFHK